MLVVFSKKQNSFTLIELIIVVVIIGILALVAIPRYFANITKATKSQVYANLDAIRQAALAYYAVYSLYPGYGIWPIAVIVDGDTIVSLENPSSSAWSYYISSGSGSCPNTSSRVIQALKLPGGTYHYSLCTDGYTYQNPPP
ncbi:MAG: prepilin-type N-terminal cleavage/methylation domain-containing protein [Candidatus Omnitrophota bacterium]|jgi:prepilin-type N-terminal cleavage/methylation domain-containing protein